MNTKAFFLWWLILITAAVGDVVQGFALGGLILILCGLCISIAVYSGDHDND